MIGKGVTTFNNELGRYPNNILRCDRKLKKERMLSEEAA